VKACFQHKFVSDTIVHSSDSLHFYRIIENKLEYLARAEDLQIEAPDDDSVNFKIRLLPLPLSWVHFLKSIISLNCTFPSYICVPFFILIRPDPFSVKRNSFGGKLLRRCSSTSVISCILMVSTPMYRQSVRQNYKNNLQCSVWVVARTTHWKLILLFLLTLRKKVFTQKNSEDQNRLN
jgi:hypothetical protein